MKQTRITCPVVKTLDFLHPALEITIAITSCSPLRSWQLVCMFAFTSHPTHLLLLFDELTHKTRYQNPLLSSVLLLVLSCSRFRLRCLPDSRSEQLELHREPAPPSTQILPKSQSGSPSKPAVKRQCQQETFHPKKSSDSLTAILTSPQEVQRQYCPPVRTSSLSKQAFLPHLMANFSYLTNWLQVASPPGPPTEWQNFTSIHQAQKSALEAARIGRPDRGNVRSGLADGVLLYGPTGVGKNKLINSWCMEIKGVIVNVNRAAWQRFYEDPQTFARSLSDEAANLAKSQPVILLFDEAHLLISQSVEGNMTSRQTSFFKFFDMASKLTGEIYLFAATSRPEAIDMAIWGHHFPQRWHIRLPNVSSRAMILQEYLTAFHQQMPEEDLHIVADRLVNRSPRDIRSLVNEAYESKTYKSLLCTSWRIIDREGRRFAIL